MSHTDPSRRAVPTGDDGTVAHQVRDALVHLYDPVYLQAHPLVRLVTPDRARDRNLGHALRQLLVQAIEALHPSTDAPPGSDAWRRYQLLHLRYMQGLDAAAVQDQLAISQSTYYREHQRGVEAVLALFRERLGLAPSVAELPSTHELATPSPEDPRQRQSEQAVPITNLPLPLSSFVGRAGELAEVRRLLSGARLVTLTGTGGCGKTRLALEVAGHLMGAYDDGVWLVELASLADPLLVPHAVAVVLGVPEEPGHAVLTTLVTALQQRRLLLVLDNCEHLLDGSAQVTETVLRGCPGVRVLATSREALWVPGEMSWRVPSLPVPPPDEHLPLEHVAQYDAVRLFVERARAALPGFTVSDQRADAVARVCRRLDGIPLAIELAAARVQVLSVEQLAARLDQRFQVLTGGSRTMLPRQQTLRATVDWSYDLLDEPERRLFGRLSVFAGGWTLEAAEQVCTGEGLDADDVLDLLARLVAKSLVIAEEGADGKKRYRLLETLRQYGLERLVASRDTERMGNWHAMYYLPLAEEAAPELWGPPPGEWLDWVERELDNLRAALRWFVQRHDIEQAARISQTLAGLWFKAGYWTEGRSQLHSVLALPGWSGRTATRANVLANAAHFAYRLGDYAAARSLAEERLALHRGLGDRPEIAQALSTLGVYVREQGDVAAARTFMEEGLALCRELGDHRGMAHTLIRLGELAQAQGEYGLAQSRYEESRASGQGADDDDLAVRLPHHLGSLALDQGKYAAARTWFVQSLRHQQEQGTRIWMHSSLADFVCLAAAEGQPEHAMRLAGTLATWAEMSGAVLQPTERVRFEQWLATAQRTLGEQASAAAWAAGRALSLEQAIAEALAGDVGRSASGRIAEVTARMQQDKTATASSTG